MQTIQTAFTLGKTVLPRTAVLAPMACLLYTSPSPRD